MCELTVIPDVDFICVYSRDGTRRERVDAMTYCLLRHILTRTYSVHVTRYEGDVYPKVDATNNWWGYGTNVFVSGRIMERRDDDYLIGVNYQPFHETNTTILQGLPQSV